jgi:hypothetical protein
MDDSNAELTILPRRRAGQPEDMKRDPIILTKKDLQELYSMRLSEAAAKLVSCAENVLAHEIIIEIRGCGLNQMVVKQANSTLTSIRAHVCRTFL